LEKHNEAGIQVLIYSVEFFTESEAHDPAAQTHQPWTRHSRPRRRQTSRLSLLFYTQLMQQPTAVYPNNDEEDEDEDTLGHAQAVATGAGVGGGNKKGESHMISGFTDKENEVLCISWLAVSQDSINGSQQKGQAYWRKVSQEYNKRKLYKPSFNIIKNGHEESIKNNMGLHQARDTQVMRCDRPCPCPPRERHQHY
jgi:hypothetical protein